jgi:3'(2'), 5'-bisphosphate nucleotidase
MPFEKELTVALAAAEAAGRLIREHYDRFVPIPDAPSDITTEADRASQELILQTIRREFPADALVAEEKTPTLQSAAHTGPRLWIVDPIDGTRGFAVKNGEFSVMIGFVEHGRIAVGVVLEPADWKVTYAVRDGGCWRYNQPGGAKSRCRVGNAPNLAAAALTQSRSRTAKESPVVKKLKPTRIVECYSAGVKMAKVASGEVDLYANIYPAFNDWDICAGHILVEESGGKVTTLAGEPIVYGGEESKQRNGLLATNGLIHQEAIAAMTNEPPMNHQ